MNTKIFIFAFMVSSLWAAQSQVAFTSREEMNRHSADVQKNVMYRNPGNVEGTEQCEYIREYVIKYALNNHQHTSIWYYVMQCYDKDFKQVGDDLYSFNYDGNAEKLFKLPPGCPPPVVEDKKKNPCENGIALGDQLYKDITEITTKKLTEHPLSAINGQPKEEPKGTTTEKKENGRRRQRDGGRTPFTAGTLGDTLPHASTLPRPFSRFCVVARGHLCIVQVGGVPQAPPRLPP